MKKIFWISIAIGAVVASCSDETRVIAPKNPDLDKVTSVKLSPSLDTLKVGEYLIYDVSPSLNGTAWSSSDSSIASVNSTGVAHAVAPGVATITVKVRSSRASATVVVVPKTQPDTTTPPDTASTPPSDTGTVAAPPALPQNIPMGSDPYALQSCTVNVPAGGDVNAAIAAAHGGDIICPAMGATYGSMYLPVRSDTGYVEIRGCTLPIGTRITPTTAAPCPKFATPYSATPVVATAARASHYILRGLEFTTGPTTTLTYSFVQLGTGDATQASVDSLPNHILLEQDYIHTTSTNEMQRCVQFNGAWLAIVESWVSECHGNGYDTQAVGGWSGTGPYLIENNYLEASGENILFGGASPAADGLTAYDITIRRNWIRKPASWIGSQWTIKNLIEIKVAHRALIEQNVLDGSWVQAQTGYGILVKSSADAPYRHMNSEDVTIRDNRMTHVGAGFAITGRENYENPSYITLYPQDKTQRISIANNYVDSINVAPYTGDGRLLLTGGVTDGVADFSFVHNTLVTTAALNGFLIMTAPASPAVDRFDFQRNLVSEGQYGLVADVSASGSVFGAVALPLGAVPYSFSNNVLSRGSDSQGAWTYPAGTTVATSLSAAFQDAATVGAGADLARIELLTAGVVTP